MSQIVVIDVLEDSGHLANAKEFDTERGSL